jgi:hypothetical protein
VPAVLSVWAPAVAWLSLAAATADHRLLFPYSVGFAAHLAIFGVSRLAFQFRDVSLVKLVARAVVSSSVLVLIPYAAVVGSSTRTAASVGAGVLGIAAGTILFTAAQRSIRNTPQDASRWILQAVAAFIATLSAWAINALV